MAGNRDRAWQPTLALPGGSMGTMLAVLGKHAVPLAPEAAAVVARVTAAAAAVQADLAALSAGAPGQAATPGAPAAAGQAGAGAAPAQAPPAPPADGEAAAAGQPSGFKKEVEDDANYIFQQARRAPGTPVRVRFRVSAAILWLATRTRAGTFPFSCSYGR